MGKEAVIMGVVNVKKKRIEIKTWEKEREEKREKGKKVREKGERKVRGKRERKKEILTFSKAKFGP